MENPDSGIFFIHKYDMQDDAGTRLEIPVLGSASSMFGVFKMSVVVQYDPTKCCNMTLALLGMVPFSMAKPIQKIISKLKFAVKLNTSTNHNGGQRTSPQRHSTYKNWLE
jgi:hypothetical protein